MAFRVVAGGGSVFAGFGMTNDSGIAKERWTLGTVASGDHRVEARAVDPETGEGVVFGTFSATAVPDVPVSIAKTAGDHQVGVAGATLPDSLTVKVADKFGNGVPGVTVTWTVTSGGGSLSQTSATTNGLGRAKVRWSLGTIMGANASTASVSGIPNGTVSFAATGTFGAPATITIVDGNNQTARVETALPVRPAVKVTDANGNAVNNAVVHFTVTGGGGSVSGIPGVTEFSGIAKVGNWTMGATPGANQMVATVAGLAGVSVTFIATATALFPD
jgi:hypothetical protein